MCFVLQSRAVNWRRLCCQAMLAVFLTGALGIGLLDRFPSTRTDSDARAQAKSQVSRVQRLNADALSWVSPIAAASGMVLLSGEYRQVRDDGTVPRARAAVAVSDRAPPIYPRSASALRHTQTI